MLQSLVATAAVFALSILHQEFFRSPLFSDPLLSFREAEDLESLRYTKNTELGNSPHDLHIAQATNL